MLEGSSRVVFEIESLVQSGQAVVDVYWHRDEPQGVDTSAVHVMSLRIDMHRGLNKRVVNRLDQEFLGHARFLGDRDDGLTGQVTSVRLDAGAQSPLGNNQEREQGFGVATPAKNSSFYGHRGKTLFFLTSNTYFRGVAFFLMVTVWHPKNCKCENENVNVCFSWSCS